MMDRRAFLGTMTGSLLAMPLAAGAQQVGKLVRVGVLSPGSSTEAREVQREPFERGLRELGWLPGSTFAVEYRYAEGSVARLADLAAELVRLRVDVLVARGSIAIRAARQATSIIPIVMSSADDPVADGFVKSLARPGANITGIANLVSDLDGKRLALLKEALPGLARVAVLANPNMDLRRYKDRVAALLATARAMGVDVQVFEITRPQEIADVFGTIDKARVGAVLLRADTQVLEPNRPQVVAMTAKYRLPAMYPWNYYVEIGGLMSYATSIPGFHHRSATYVDRILRGAKPADLPVEQPTKFELVINLKTAKALGLTIPPSLLQRADQVIE
jgi:putative ABC transport system substrate-binding protein